MSDATESLKDALGRAGVTDQALLEGLSILSERVEEMARSAAAEAAAEQTVAIRAAVLGDVRYRINRLLDDMERGVTTDA